MGGAPWGTGAGGQAALEADCTTDLETLGRVVARLRAGMAGVDVLSRHERLDRPAETLDRRTVSLLRHRAGGGQR